MKIDQRTTPGGEKGLLPVSPRRLVVVSSWQPLSLQCSKPTVEGTRQRLPHTNNRLGKLTFHLMVEICWALFASLPSLLKPWKGQFYQMMLTCTTVCVWLCFMYDLYVYYTTHVQQSVCDHEVHSTQWKSTQFCSEFIFCVTNLFFLSQCLLLPSQLQSEEGGGKRGKREEYNVQIW